MDKEIEDLGSKLIQYLKNNRGRGNIRDFSKLHNLDGQKQLIIDAGNFLLRKGLLEDGVEDYYFELSEAGYDFKSFDDLRKQEKLKSKTETIKSWRERNWFIINLGSYFAGIFSALIPMYLSGKFESKESTQKQEHNIETKSPGSNFDSAHTTSDNQLPYDTTGLKK